MKIRNLTKISSEQLRELIKFAQPSGVSAVFITFKHRQSYCGRAYVTSWKSSQKGDGRFYLEKKRGHTELPDVVLGLPQTPKGPGKIEHSSVEWTRKVRRGYLGSVEYTQEEAILHLLAHELRHLWQSKVPKGWRVWGARGQFSERDTDAYAISRVRHWRRRGSPFYGPKGEVAL